MSFTTIIRKSHINGLLVKSTVILSSSIRYMTTSAVRLGYRGSWINPRRLQNPNLVRDMPTFQFVGDGKFKKQQLIYVCGTGLTGGLGLPRYYQPAKKTSDELRPKDITATTFRRLAVFSRSDQIHDIACGRGFTLVAAKVPDSSHSAFGFGLNTHSQIGCHEGRPGYPLEIVNTPIPIFLPTTLPIKMVSCGRAHSILVDEKGQVFSIGDNSLGQCGRPIRENEIYFNSKKVHQLEVPDDVKQVECGQDHTMILTEAGRVFSCGWGADGQTGLGHCNNEPQPTEVKGDIKGVHIVKVSSYADTVLALDKQGNLFGWGNSEYSQFRVLANNESEQFNVPINLKLRNVPGKIVDVAAGGTICAILNDKGQVFVWGFGILGKGPKVDQSSHPTLIPETLFGMNQYNPDNKVEQIYASISHFAAIDSRGDLYTWGKNRGFALGFAHSKNQYFPMRVNMNAAATKRVALGVDHTCAIVEKVC